MFVVRREAHNPILAPDKDRPWEAVATFNPSVVATDEGVHIFYRALGNPDVLQTPHAGLSSIGTAFSEDGMHFHSRRQVIAPQEEWDKFGCEDPRVTHFEGKWYCFYTALGGYPFGPDNIKVGLAVGEDPENFTERHLITPFNAKAATLFPERINGEVILLLTAHTDYTEQAPRPTIALARAKEVADFFNPDYWHTWHEHIADHALPELRRTDGDHIEVGAAPLKTDLGWLLVYSYIENYYDEHTRTFTIEAALLDRDNPQKLVSRTESFLVPQETYEVYGLVPRIVFPTGATISPSTKLGAGSDRLDIWYGAADTVCAKASMRLNDFLRALDPERTARTFIRYSGNPILAPQGAGFESRDVFNAAAVDVDGMVHILYRAMDAANTSSIGLAISKDGTHIDERLPEPIYAPRADFEQKLGTPDGNSGCEDPRIVIIPSTTLGTGGSTLHMTYTAYDGVHAPKGAHTSISVEDFLARKFDSWAPPTLITPEEIDDKDTALLPEVIEDNYVVYHRVGGIICADLIPDLSFAKRVSRCIEVLLPRRGMWDSAKVGIAGPPIKIPHGWLMIYHGVSRHATYRLGAALLDPSGLEVIARTADPIFEPLEPYERAGEVKDVVFSCGHVVRGDTLYLYYGAADRVLGVATASLSHIIAALT